MGSRLHIIRSNRVESLLEPLGDSLGNSDPFAPELLVVQGRGMAIWLNLQLALRFGVCANLRYLYPRNLISEVFEWVLGPEEEAMSYARDALFWAALAAFPELLPEPEFAPLSRYLERDAHGHRRLQLALRVAETMDEYLTYRPDLLTEWEQVKPAPSQLSLFGASRADPEVAWQARLWRRMRGERQGTHFGARERELGKALRKRGELPSLPERLSVFGLTNLPPLFLRVLSLLSLKTEVRLYLLAPSRRTSEPGTAKNPEVLRNRLLRSYGALSFEFHGVLADAQQATGAKSQIEEIWTEPGASVLGQVQRDILHDTESEPLLVIADDDSIAFHACHSAIREVEVLQDRLLDLIHQQGFRPHEIAVMSPNIDEYAPLIQAVFDRDPSDPRFIPFTISDRSLPGHSPLIDAFFRVLELVDQRVSSAQVLDLLTQAPVRERFQVAATELETIRRWVLESGARWGMDGQYKVNFGVPADPTNSWEFAVRRLVLGYAVSTDEQDTVLGVLPYSEIEGQMGVLLGRFCRYLDSLFECLRELSEPRSVVEWQRVLVQLVERLLQPDAATAWEQTNLFDAISRLAESATREGFQGTLHVVAMSQLLRQHFDQDRSARGFLSSGVTFCAMTPMRSIPLRVVYLLGMNDGEFPRATFRADFSLLDKAGARRAGDPNRRMDDRYLFLECLLAARERFVVSFVGQSIRDNSDLAPSIVVTELLEYLEERSASPEHSEPRRAAASRFEASRWVTLHPLQPFSPRYYQGDDPRLFSYESSYLRGAEQLSHPKPSVSLFHEPLDMPSIEELGLAELIEFFGAPLETLLRRRLGIDLRDEGLTTPEREPLALDPLALYQVGANVLNQRLGGVDKERALELSRATGGLPRGASGDLDFEQVLGSAEPIAELVREICIHPTYESYPVELRLSGGVVLRGELPKLWRTGVVRVQFSRVRGKHVLQSWVQHLALCCLAPDGVAPNSWIVGRPDKGEGVKLLRLNRVEDPESLLLQLVRYYQLGQTQPLLLFPDASLAFARSLAKSGGDVSKALWAATSAWRTERDYSSALGKVFGAEAELEETGPRGVVVEPEFGFRALAEELLGPLVEHLEECR